jgi:hypothetical protein
MSYSVIMEMVTVQPTVREISLRIFLLLMQVYSNFEYPGCFRHIFVE